jgi:hypothetical protein
MLGRVKEGIAEPPEATADDHVPAVGSPTVLWAFRAHGPTLACARRAAAYREDLISLKAFSDTGR